MILSMDQERILCIDFGTTYCKYALFSQNSDILLQSEIPIDNTQAPSIWKELLIAIFSQLPIQISAIAISGHGPTILFLDSDGKLCLEPQFWYDLPENFPIQGDSFYIPKIASLVKKYPHLLQRVAFILPFPEYICYLLGADPSVILPRLAYQSYIWTDVEIQNYKLPRNWFPKFIPMTKSLATVSSRAANEYKITRGIPLYCGGTDYLMSLLGSSCIKEGAACNRAGTSDAINICTSKSKSSLFFHIPHILEKLFSAAYFLPKGKEDINTITDYLRHISRKKISIASLPLSIVARSFMIRSVILKAEEEGIRIQYLVLSGGKNKAAKFLQLQSNIIGTPLFLPYIVHTELLGLFCLVRYIRGYDKSLTNSIKKFFRVRKYYQPQQKKSLDKLFQDARQALTCL